MPHIWHGYDRNKPLPKHVSQLLWSREDRRTEGKDSEELKKKKNKGRKRVIVAGSHEVRTRLQQTRARDELLHPRGRRSHVKQTYPKT